MNGHTAFNRASIGAPPPRGRKCGTQSNEAHRCRKGEGAQASEASRPQSRGRDASLYFRLFLREELYQEAARGVHAEQVRVDPVAQQLDSLLIDERPRLLRSLDANMFSGRGALGWGTSLYLY